MLLLLSKYYSVPLTSGSSRGGLGPDVLGAVQLQSREGHLPKSTPIIRWCYRQDVGRQWDSDPHQLSASAHQKERTIKNLLYKCTVAGSRAACVDFSGSYKARDVFYTLRSAYLCLWDFKNRCGVYLLQCSKGGGLGKDQREVFSNAWLFSVCQCKRKHVCLVLEYRNSEGKVAVSGRVEVHLSSRRGDVQVGDKP